MSNDMAKVSDESRKTVCPDSLGNSDFTIDNYNEVDSKNKITHNLEKRVDSFIQSFNKYILIEVCYTLFNIDDFIDDCFEFFNDNPNIIKLNPILQNDLDSIFIMSKVFLERLFTNYKNINEDNTYGLEKSDCITISMVMARAFDFTQNMDKFRNKFC
jgi:hypothetical protein